MIIGMTYDLKTEYVFKRGDPPDANAEFDHPLTIGVIEDAFQELGHRVVRIGSAEHLLKKLDHLCVDLVFNIAEGLQGRNRESQVPVILEMRGVPYIGADGLTQALTLDKLMAKKIFLAEGIPTPRFFELHHPDQALPPDIAFPLIVKPRFEGSSKGLSEKSVARSARELRAQAAWLIHTYRQPAIVEEFIQGTEFTVAVIGNDPLEAWPVVQIQIDGQTDLGDLFYTFSRIAEGAGYLVPAKIDRALQEKLKELAVRVYRAVDCRDFGRVDFRVDKAGNPYALEINPLPSLSTEDVFAVLATHLGLSYTQMIGRILDAAVKRLGMKVREPRASKMAGQRK